MTTIQHQLKSLPLSAVFSDNVTKEELWATESVRALERGSRIVASDAQGTKVILQVSYLDIKAEKMFYSNSQWTSIKYVL